MYIRGTNAIRIRMFFLLPTLGCTLKLMNRQEKNTVMEKVELFR